MRKKVRNSGYQIYFDRSEFRDIYPFKHNFTRINGYQMHYVDEGQGQTILMVHGNPTWSFYYRRLISHFSKEYRVVVPDHIGYGYSDKPTKYHYTVGNQIKNITAFIEKLDLKNIILVCHDWGGAFGTGYAIDHPENIKKIVYMNTGAFSIPEEILKHHPWQMNIVRIPLLGPVLVRAFNAFSQFAFLWAITRKERRTRKVKKGLIAPYNNWKNRVAVLKAVQDIPLSEKVASFDVMNRMEENLKILKDKPIMVFWGLKDFVFTTPVLHKWQEFFPNMKYKQYEDAGHYVLEDAYERIIPEMDKFLKNHST